MKTKIIQFLTFAVTWTLGYLILKALWEGVGALTMANVLITVGCGFVGAAVFVAVISLFARKS